MNEKELKKMSRSELLEILIAQAEENKELKIRLQRAEQLRGERKIALENAGSIAEAALKLNGVFEAAEEAAKQYLENIKFLNDRAESIYKSEEEDARRQADSIIAEALEYQKLIYEQTARDEKRPCSSKRGKGLRAARTPSDKIIQEHDGDEQ